MEFRNKNSERRNNIFDDKATNTNWLIDNDWSDLNRNHSKHNKNAYDSGKDDEKVNINIKFSLPKASFDSLKSIKSKTVKIFRPLATKYKALNRNYRYGSIALILILAISAVGFTIFNKSENNTKKVAGTSTSIDGTAQNLLPKEKPAYKILYPGTKNSESVGEVVRISPPGQNPAYTYVDSINDVQIQVTQQEIPDNLKDNTESQLTSLAKANYQSDIFQVDGVTVYSGKSTKGAQSLTFIKGNLLIFIKSTNLISEEAWVAYISALHS